jgi:hypothetical protein
VELGRRVEAAKMVTPKLTLEDLERMRHQYRIAQEQQAPPGARSTYELLEDLEQVGVLEEVGMRLERWALLRDVPMEYALALREYLDQEEKQEANQKGTQAVGHRAR